MEEKFTLESIKNLFEGCDVHKFEYVLMDNSKLKSIYEECKPTAIPTIEELLSELKLFKRFRLRSSNCCDPCKPIVSRAHFVFEFHNHGHFDDNLYYNNVEALKRTLHLAGDAFEILGKSNCELSQKGNEFVIDFTHFLRFANYEELLKTEIFRTECKFTVGIPLLGSARLPYLGSLTREFFSIALARDFLYDAPYRVLCNESDPHWQKMAEAFAEKICNL